MRPVIVNYNRDNPRGIGVAYWPDEKLRPVAVGHVEVRLFLRLNAGPWMPWPGEEAPQIDVGWMRRATALPIIRHLKRDGAQYRVEQRRTFTYVVACPWCNARADQWEYDCDGQFPAANCGSPQCSGPPHEFDTGDDVYITLGDDRVSGVIDYVGPLGIYVEWNGGKDTADAVAAALPHDRNGTRYRDTPGGAWVDRSVLRWR